MHPAEQNQIEGVDDHPWAPFAHKWLGRAEKVLGVGLALTVGSLTYQGLCAALGCRNAGPGLPSLFMAAIAGLLAIGSFKVLVEDWRHQWPRRFAANGAALLLIFTLLVLPAQRSGEAALEQKEKQRTARLEADAAQDKAEEAWRAGLLARGEHAPPGVVPPSLQVEQVDGGVVVTNTTQKPLSIALARVREDPGAPGGWRACAMHTDGATRGVMRFYSYSLKPGERATFVALETCAHAFKDALLEYRIGRYPEAAGWWSDSAFAAPKGREYADGK